MGPESLKLFEEALADAKTVLWNGPLGVFEFDKFAAGTLGIAHDLAKLTAQVRVALLLRQTEEDWRTCREEGECIEDV